MLWCKQSKEENRQNFQRYAKSNPEKVLLNAARARAKQQNLPFDIDVSDVIIPDVCPYLKTPFEKGTMYAASIDKIRPELGYVKGNVEVISRKANVMKNNASTEELLEFAYTILERN